MDDFELDGDDVAAQMGFGSFGEQSKNKKRKLDLSSVDVKDSDKPTTKDSQVTQTIRDTLPAREKVEKSETTADTRAIRNTVRNEHGDLAYFMPSFIEDPWADLMKKRGA